MWKVGENSIFMWKSPWSTTCSRDFLQLFSAGIGQETGPLAFAKF